MKSLFLAAMCVLQAPPPTDGVSRPLKVGDILDRWEAGARLIESYDLRLELRTKSFLVYENGVERMVDEKSAEPRPAAFSRIYRKGEMRRGEFFGETRDGAPVTLIWDGKESRTLQPGDKSVRVSSMILCFGSLEYEDYEMSYRNVRGTLDRISLCKIRKSRLLPREGRFYVVDVPGPSSFREPHYTNLRWKIWLDPDRNFLPARMAEWIVKEDHDEHNIDTENELREVGPAVWAPVRSTMRVYVKGEKSPIYGKCMMICDLIVQQDQSRFNIDLDDGLFGTAIPTGTTVVDGDRKVVYTAGSENADKYLAQIAKQEKAKFKSLSPRDRPTPGMVIVPDDDRPGWAKTLWIGGAAALIVVAVYALIRFRARGSA